MARSGHFSDGFSYSRDLPEERHEMAGIAPIAGKKKKDEEQSSMGATSISGNSMGQPTIQEAHSTSSMGNWGAKGKK